MEQKAHDFSELKDEALDEYTAKLCLPPFPPNS